MPPEMIAPWAEACKKLKEKLDAGDLDKFISWDFIHTTMFHIPALEELRTLQESDYWEKWKGALKEHSFGGAE